jgi:hypothetical protein
MFCVHLVEVRMRCNCVLRRTAVYHPRFSYMAPVAPIRAVNVADAPRRLMHACMYVWPAAPAQLECHSWTRLHALFILDLYEASVAILPF